MKSIFQSKNLLPSMIFFLLVLIAREVLTFNGIIMAKYFLTPLITASIAFTLLLSIRNTGMSNYKMIILTALFFSIIADTLMMIVEVDLMLYGIVFFLLTHVCYLIAFTGGYRFKKWNTIIGLMLLLFVALFFSLISSKLGSYFAPVVVYMIMLSCMVYFALSKLNNGVSRQSILLAVGALLFLTSDSILAVNAFAIPIPHSTVYTWATYAPAQMLIVLSTFD